jgi:hypothetical protein
MGSVRRNFALIVAVLLAVMVGRTIFHAASHQGFPWLISFAAAVLAGTAICWTGGWMMAKYIPEQTDS